MLNLSFFDDDPHTVARNLLGSTLVRLSPQGLCTAEIVEVEVYGGGEDGSSHANSNKPTKKTRTMFGEPGTVYVYAIHRYYCLNVVTRAGTRPSAILIRAARPVQGLELMATRRGVELEARHASKKLLSGPGKLCQALAITTQDNGLSFDSELLHIEQGASVPDEDVVRTQRVGLNPKTCGDSVTWPWRYMVRDSPYVSKKPKA